MAGDELRGLERQIHRGVTAMQAEASAWLEAMAREDAVDCPGCEGPVRACSESLLVPHLFQAWHPICHEAVEGYGWRVRFPEAERGDLEAALARFAEELGSRQGWVRVGDAWRSPGGHPGEGGDAELLGVLEMGAECCFDEIDADGTDSYLGAFEWLGKTR